MRPITLPARVDTSSEERRLRANFGFGKSGVGVGTPCSKGSPPVNQVCLYVVLIIGPEKCRFFARGLQSVRFFDRGNFQKLPFPFSVR
jgi:hypothetical protein